MRTGFLAYGGLGFANTAAPAAIICRDHVSGRGDSNRAGALPEPQRFGAARERRQLYARDRRTGRLVYLPEGEVEAFRADCDAGYLICPLPQCADPRYLAVGGAIRRHHFRHRTPGLPPHGQRAWNHLTAKLLLGQHLRERHPELTITQRRQPGRR